MCLCHPGPGHASFLQAMETIGAASDAMRSSPDVIIRGLWLSTRLRSILCRACWPRPRPLAGHDPRRPWIWRPRGFAAGKLVLVHEGGYSEVYVPFCGHATIAALAGSDIVAPDPMAETFALRQPGARFDAMVSALIDDYVAALA